MDANGNNDGPKLINQVAGHGVFLSVGGTERHGARCRYGGVRDTLGRVSGAPRP